ncbi:MAG: DUF11 domain-containing protein, partial [Promicromonosporaceae bacterium]|nr:DUF11 domain-containing protein [Promicromonosporaceae bacterium]
MVEGDHDTAIDFTAFGGEGDGSDDVPDDETFWQIGSDGVAYEVDQDGNPVIFDSTPPGADATPRGPTFDIDEFEDADHWIDDSWGEDLWDGDAWDGGINFGEDFAAFAAAIDPFNACTQPIRPVPTWSNGTTSATTSRNDGMGAGPGNHQNTFYAYVAACDQLDVRFITNQWVAAHGWGVEYVRLEITSPTGVVTTVRKGRGATAGQPATGANADANGRFGTDHPLQRLGLRSSTAGVWRIRTILLDRNQNPRTGINGSYGWNPNRWDISIRTPGGTHRLGQVWTESFYGQTSHGLTAQRSLPWASSGRHLRWDQRHYILSNEGLQFQVTQRQYNGIHSSFRASGLGVHRNCTPTFRSVWRNDGRLNPNGRQYSVTRDGCSTTRFRIFFDQPASRMPTTARWFDQRTAQTWVNPTQANPTVTVTYEHGGNATHYGGTIVVRTTAQRGDVTVTVSGRTFTLRNVAPGTHRVAWNGNNGGGTRVALTTSVTINATLSSGRVHFISNDVEYRERGIEVRALNGRNANSTRINWGEPYNPTRCSEDGRTLHVCGGRIPSSANVSGTNVASGVGVHRWGRNTGTNTSAGAGTTATSRPTATEMWGDERWINEWTNPITTSSSVTVRSAGSCTMSGAPRIIQPGTERTHTVTVRNDGNFSRSMTTTVNLGPALQAGRTTFVANSHSANRGNVTWSAANSTLTWAGTLNAGQTATITYRIRAVAAPNNASFTTTATVAAPGGGTCSVVNEVQALPPNPTCTKTANARVIQPGATTTHTLTVTNTGNQQRALSSVTNIASHLASGRFVFVDVTASVGTATRSSDNISWNGTLAPGARATITYRLRAANPSTGVATVTATTTLTPGGNTCAATNETTAPPVPPPPPPTCTQTAAPRVVQPGATTTHTITVRNDGNQQRALSSRTSIANHLPGGRFEFVSVT